MITGKPHAIASAIGSPKPSPRKGNARHPQELYRRLRSNACEIVCYVFDLRRPGPSIECCDCSFRSLVSIERASPKVFYNKTNVVRCCEGAIISAQQEIKALAPDSPPDEENLEPLRCGPAGKVLGPVGKLKYRCLGGRHVPARRERLN